MTHDPRCNLMVSALMAQQRKLDAERALKQTQERRCTQSINAAQRKLNKATLEAIRIEVQLCQIA